MIETDPFGNSNQNPFETSSFTTFGVASHDSFGFVMRPSLDSRSLSASAEMYALNAASDSDSIALSSQKSFGTLIQPASSFLRICDSFSSGVSVGDRAATRQ